MNRILLYLFLALSFGSIQAQDHLLITEVAMTPTSGEFIEIYNPTNSAIPLDNYYLADYNDYFRVVENQLTDVSSDFIVKFPAGASIEPGGILVIALEGDGLPGADFEIESRSDVTDMEALFVGGSAGLTNSAEIVVLFHWDGISDLVQDVDYLAWGSASDRFVDKTNIAIDGPDAGADSTFYLPDTPQASQLTVTLAHDVGESFQRISATETDEANSGGNGLTGHNETSENMGASFIIAGSNAGQGFGTPLFGVITQTPENPSEADAVTITATVTDDGSLTAVRLIYSVDGVSDSTDMSLLGGSQYGAVIPPQSGGSVVSYFVRATDDQANTATSASFGYTTTVSAPVISNIGISPTSPSPADDVTVSADVSDNGTLIDVSLFYSVNGGNEITTAMSSNGDTYSTTIPAQAEGSQVLYYIVAEDNDNNVTASDPLSYAITVPGEKHLLITEICVTPAANEFVEIHNPTNNTINLSDYYFTDATFAGGSSYYYNIVTGENIGGGGFSDFHARFPQGALIGPGEYQTIAMNGSDFVAAYGSNPTYELYDTNGGITDMLEAGSGSIAGQGGLTDAGEMVVVYFWDGASDLVQDIDYVVWGDKAEAVDKTGVATDGPDADSTPSSYLDDVSIENQIAVSSDAPHASGESIQRLGVDEINESAMGGNGITGHNEMSEDLALAFQIFPPSPGSAGPEPGTPIISSITRTPLTPGAEDNVVIAAEIVDTDGTIVNARLLFTIDGGAQDSIKMTNTSGDLFEATIAAQPVGSSVAYQVKGFDNDGKIVLSALESYTVVSSEIGGPHLVFSEIAVQPTAGEFVEIFNPTDAVIDLSDYYFTDATFSGGNFYYNIVGSGDPGGGGFGDFHVRFPAGATIAPNEAQTIAINGAAFSSTYGMEATYEVLSTTPNVTDMREAFTGSIDPGSGLTNAGEVAILYYWDGISDLVKDIDYVVWGDKAEAVDKTGVSIDGPDPDNIPSGYQPDVSIENQIALSAEAPHAVGESVQRLNFIETDEIASAGNGITGHNEMSENLAASFSIGIPTPNSAPVPGAPVIDTLYIDPAEPAADEAVAVNAVIIDADGQIVSATLSYSINNGTFIPINMTPVGADIYQATIPGQATGSVVQYFLEVTDNDDKTAVSTTQFYIVGAVDGVIPIAGIQDNVSLFLDETVTIEGVITLGAGILIDSRVDAYIQDNSGKGINIFSFDPPDVAGIGIDRFNRVRMTGRITEFGGVTEITDYSLTLLDVNQPAPAPLFVSTNVANDLSFEGTYMKVVGTVTDIGEAGGGTNITVQDDKGTVLVRVWGSTGINLSFLNLGDTLSVQGVMDVFESTAQLVPAYQDEITVPGKTARADGSGIVSASIDFVQAADTLANFDIQIIGTIEEPITTIQVDIPKLWEWDGQSADYSLDGAGESAALRVEMAPIDSVLQIFIDNADVALDDTAKISLKNLRTPKDSLNSVFWVRTAGIDGRLSFVNDVPMVNVGGGDRYLIYDIQTRSSLFDGSLRIEGVTTIGAGLLRQTSSAGDSLTTAYIQDESGRGINLFRFGLIDPALVRGNLVSVSGTITEFNGVTEMEYNSISEIAEGAPIPAPLELTNSLVNSPRWDGTLVRTAGVILEQFSAGGGTTFVIGDGNGVTNVRIWDTAGLDLSEFETNNRIFVEGVAGVFVSDEDSIYQLLPTYQDQITLDPTYAPSLADVDLSVPPNPFAPELGETLPIRYNAGEVNNRVVIRIFDLGGRLVLTLLDEQAQIIENVLQWNGLDRLRNRVALGAYVCHLEVVEPFSGKKVSKHVPIVVGTVLSR